ncbi:uncharacterized protein [Apostichopus japonicus]|uniref:uncharacterized protein isoform X3 n=1 Tax=Stichopus japonicus TaxID=307972 RepID=UPI003AB3CA8F
MTIQFTQNYTIRNTLLSTTASHYIVTIIVHSTAFVTVHLLSLEQTVFSVRKMFVKCIAYLLLLCNVIHATILTTGQCGDDAPNTNVLHHNVGDSVSLQCNISDASQALWRIDNMTAFIGYKRSALYTNQHASLRQTYILQITNIGADDGGLYKCIEHGQPVATYCILIREFTNGNLFLIKDGRRVSSEVFELANRIFNLTCKAEFPSHEEMIWDIDNRTNLSTYAEYYVSNLLSSSITISFPSQISNSTVTCLKGSLSINTTVHVIATPIIHIVLYEMNVSSPFEVSPAVLYQLQCVAYGARPVVNLTWIFDEEMQTADGQRQIENEYIHGTFNYISDIQFAAADHRWGSITCSSNGNHNALSANRTLILHYQEFPNGNLFLIKDGRRVSSEVFELANIIFNLTCKAEFPFHEEMIWDIDKHTNLSTYSEYYASNFLFASIKISFPSQISNSTVTCMKGSLSINTTVHVIATPIIHIVLYEMNVSSPFEVSPAVLYQLQCVAYGARPVVNLTWIFDEEVQTADGQSQIENEYIHGTFNYISDMQFAAADHRWGSITCSSNGNHNALSANRTLILHYQAAQEQRQWNSLTISILVSASSVILIFVIITSCSLRRKLTNDATFITYSGNMPNPSQDIFEMECTEKSMNNVVKGDNESTDHGVNIQSLKLPTLPDCDHSKNEDIYSSITETVDRQKIFERDQMNIILKLETGLSANRWMGTITTSTFKKTCVLISTFIDEGEINWDNYVRRLLALPDCEYLLKVEGICVENNTLFLLQEYVGMKTLDAYMKEKRTKHRASVDTFYKENRHFIVQILEALQHLHENGLSHPCIQARKILVTPERSTKLFDMCTREDTTHLVSMLLDTQNLQNCPHHAPECISEGIYTEFSDVWYVANVLWEMMSEDVSLITENINADYQIEAGWQAAQIQQDTKLMKPSNCSTEMYMNGSCEGPCGCGAQYMVPQERLIELCTVILVYGCDKLPMTMWG